MGSTAWFDRGVKAFQLARPGAPKCYPCPICLHDHFTPSDLTIDHFPPQSQGGRSGVLTCAECNNWAGTELEADMKLAESGLDFVAGTLTEPTDARLTMGELTLRANMKAIEQQITIAGVPEATDPAMLNAMKESFKPSTEGDVWTGPEIKLSFGRHKREDALAGWLRSAYLAVFAAWGFYYILRPELDAVRQKIRDPDADILRVFSRSMPKSEFEEPHIFFIKKPKSLSGHLAVIMGRHLVYLPGSSTTDLYGELIRESDAGSETTVTREKEVMWPKRPRYDFDFALSRLRANHRRQPRLQR